MSRRSAIPPSQMNRDSFRGNENLKLKKSARSSRKLNLDIANTFKNEDMGSKDNLFKS